MKALKSFYEGGDDFCLKLLLFILPFGLATIRHYGSTIFLLISLIVLLGLVVGKGDMKKCVGEYKYIYFCLLLFFVAMGLSFLNADDIHGFFKKLEKISYVLFIIPFLIYFYDKNFAEYLNNGILYASVVNFTVAICTVFYFNMPRAQGYYHPIIFGDIMVLFGSISLVSALRGCRLDKYFIFKIISVGLYFLAAILSGSRGAIFSFPIIVFLTFFLSEYTRKFKLYFFCSILISSVIIIVVFKFTVPAGEFNLVYKLNATSSNISRFFKGENKNSSLGQRLMMWDISLDTLNEHPFVGTGLGDFHLEITERIANKTTDLNYVWPHAHNIYFNFLAISGVFGFVTMVLALFFFTFRVAFCRYKNTAIARVNSTYFVVVLVSFMLFGLTEDWFSRSALLVTFVICFGVYSAPFSQEDEL